MITPSFGLTATERVLPRLALDWTTGVAQPGVDVVRSGVATFVGANGLIQSASSNTQRLDWSKGTPGLLVEESRTNLQPYSEQFNNAVWSKINGSVTANAITSPDGTANADLFIPSTTSAQHRLDYTSTTTAVTHAFSVYAKFGGYNFVWLRIGLNGGFVNLLDGTVSNVTVGYTLTATNVGDNWYRVVLVGAAALNSVIRINSTITAEGLDFAGNGTSGVYLYGAQLEAGAFATSYIPTEATAVTRNADVATMTGTNFSDFWQGIIGGAMVQAIPSTVSGIRPLVQYDDNTTNNIIALRGNTTNPELQIVTGGSPQAQIDSGTIVANTPYSLTGWWSLNDCRARKDAGAVVIDNTATIPTVTQARLGTDGTNYLNGHLMTVNYYDRFSSQIYTRRKNKAVFSLL